MDASHVGRITKLALDSDVDVIFALFYSSRIEYYTGFMDFLIMLIARGLEAMFLVGLVGSFGVLLVSFVEDTETLFDLEDKGHS